MKFTIGIFQKTNEVQINSNEISGMQQEDSPPNNIEEELSEFDMNPLQEGQDVVESVESLPSRSRGRPSIPDQWSQVLSLDGGNEIRIKTYLISTDKLLVQGIPPVPPTRREKQWQPLFFSKTFVEENPDITLDRFRFSAAQLKNYGVQATKLRLQIR